jgi:hypothetical protein
MMEEKKSEYRTTQSHEDSTVSPKKKSPVHTSMKIEPRSSRDRHVELAAAVGVKSPQVPASIQGPRALSACAASVWECAPVAGASATESLSEHAAVRMHTAVSSAHSMTFPRVFPDSKLVQPTRPHESVRLSTAGSERADEEKQDAKAPGDEQPGASAQAPAGAETQNAKATGNAEEGETKPEQVATEASTQEKAQREVSIEEQVASIFGELIENSVNTW